MVAVKYIPVNEYIIYENVIDLVKRADCIVDYKDSGAFSLAKSINVSFQEL